MSTLQKNLTLLNRAIHFKRRGTLVVPPLLKCIAVINGTQNLYLFGTAKPVL